MKKISTILVIALVNFGCTTAPSLTGTSLANAQLQKDIQSALVNISSAQLSCSNIELIEIRDGEVLDMSTFGMKNAAQETWVVHGCGASKTYKIRMTPGLIHNGYNFTIDM